MIIKAQKTDSRKSYSFKLSFDPKDNISHKECHTIALKIAERCFKEYECVIATHKDTEHIHSHIVVNSVSYADGKMLHINMGEYKQLNKLANDIAVQHGYSSLQYKPPKKKNLTQAEKGISLRGGTAWKEELREVINEALQNTNSIQNFEKWLKKIRNITYKKHRKINILSSPIQTKSYTR